MQETVITISRQYGSGGRIIARRLAEELGIPYYDKEIIQKVSQETGMTEHYIRQNEFQTTGSFLFDLYGMTQIMSPPDQVFVAQSKAIKGAAEQGSCVILGRCADYVLKDREDCINVFICADKEDRKKRISRIYGLSERKAAEKIRKTDRERRYYYEMHTGLEWGDIGSHQMLFNASRLGIDRIVDILAMMYQA